MCGEQPYVATGDGRPLIGVADVLGVGAIVGVAITTGVGAPPMPLKPPGDDAPTGACVPLAIGASAELPPHAASRAPARPMAPSDREKKTKRMGFIFSDKSRPKTLGVPRASGVERRATRFGEPERAEHRSATLAAPIPPLASPAIC